ncbi:MAG TPA: hypothetical protein VK911_14605, partial [Vicinamibacterales bacterium]|nr:hypothetical protein [Vicinamibacterales bacterium]
MPSILSQEEIDALLASSRHTARRGASGENRQVVEATTYDFRRPDRVSKEQIRSIHLLHDRFAREV